MSIDTQEQALAEARKRWGKRALVSDRHWRSTEQRFMVSNCDWVYGVGDSWDAAFADADARKQDV